MKRYKFLISGCGSAGRHVAQVAAADGRGEIVGLVDPQPAQLDIMQAQYPDASTGHEYARLLRETQPDVVVVAGPDHLHADQTVMALEQGCHVLVEKTACYHSGRCPTHPRRGGREWPTRHDRPNHALSASLARNGADGPIRRDWRCFLCPGRLHPRHVESLFTRGQKPHPMAH